LDGRRPAAERMCVWTTQPSVRNVSAPGAP
jgi:hypothetical protein